MTDDDIVGIRMTTPGDIKSFARAIEQKVKENQMVKIGDRIVNISSINYIIERHVFFNNGTSWVMTEPEIQELLAAMFNEPRVPTVEIVEEPLVIKKAHIKKAKK